MSNSPLRRGRHSVSRLVVHLVFVVKKRRPALNIFMLQRLEEVFISVARKMDFTILETGGETDHVHVLIEYPPTLAVSAAVNHLKGVSSRCLRAEFPELRRLQSLWSPSYFASSAGGAPIEKLKLYVQNQEKPS